MPGQHPQADADRVADNLSQDIEVRCRSNLHPELSEFNQHTDAGGTALEECGVCYLSILLADQLPNYDRVRMLEDMDHWGYSFRLGSSAAWFEGDADDAQQWLHAHGLIDSNRRITWNIRDLPSPR